MWLFEKINSCFAVNTLIEFLNYRFYTAYQKKQTKKKQKKQPPPSFLQRGYSETFHAWQRPYLVRKFQFTKKVIHHHRFSNDFVKLYRITHSQLRFTCSKSTIETLEKCVKYV